MVRNLTKIRWHVWVYLRHTMFMAARLSLKHVLQIAYKRMIRAISTITSLFAFPSFIQIYSPRFQLNAN